MAKQNKIPVFRQPKNRLRPWRYDRRTMTRDDFNRLVSAYYLDSSKSDGPYYGTAYLYDAIYRADLVSGAQLLNRGFASYGHTLYADTTVVANDYLVGGGSIIENPVGTKLEPLASAKPHTFIYDVEKLLESPSVATITIGHSNAASAARRNGMRREADGTLVFQSYDGAAADYGAAYQPDMPSGRLRIVQTFDTVAGEKNVWINGLKTSLNMPVGSPDFVIASSVNATGTNITGNTAQVESGWKVNRSQIADYTLSDSMALEESTAHMGAEIEVYGIAGQSNASGRALIGDFAAVDQKAQGHVLYYFTQDPSDPGGADARADTLGFLTAGTGYANESFTGPDVFLGKQLAALRPGKIIALVRYAAGGTSLNTDWKPATGAEYAQFNVTMAAGVAALEAAYPGRTVTVKGIAWDQGEADTGTSANATNYEANLNELVAAWRVIHGADMPFVFRRLSPTQIGLDPTNLALIRTSMESVASADSLVGMVDSDLFTVKAGDTLHFDGDGQTNNGTDMASAMAVLL